MKCLKCSGNLPKDNPVYKKECLECYSKKMKKKCLGCDEFKVYKFTKDYKNENPYNYCYDCGQERKKALESLNEN